MEDLLNKIREFNERRSWGKYHDPRSLVLALCGEVGELAQFFRWRKRSARRLSAKDQTIVEKEIADIFIFLLSLCVALNIDPRIAIMSKLAENDKRFPVDR